MPDNTNTPSTNPFNKNDANGQPAHTVRFDPADGSRPTQSTVENGALAFPPENNPIREGFRFDGWALNDQPFDFQTPIIQDTALKAQWTKTTDWTLSPDHGPASGARLTISPPDRQEPYYVSVQAAGEQTVGLTGDGRIYTWTQDSPPKQVPFPAQAPDGFHYLQAAAGSRLQAALGSDQHIYTWTSRQPTPTILDTSRNTQFSSISINDNLLLAVDQQGQVHTYQTSQTGNQNTKPTEQATLSLPGQAQAVTAAASASQALILDADGQTWTWDKANSGNAKPERVKQDPGMRIIQAQTLSNGCLLLNADRQAWYLADNTTAMIQISLPDSAQASRITANKDQAIITGKDGRLWAWKPGSKPARADKRNHHYIQAASIGNSIIAADKQSGVFVWNLVDQGQDGKRARLDTTVAPALESASMDGQPLTLKKTGGVWQTKATTHKPGPAAILIAGKQDGQPFSRSLDYTVKQPLTRDSKTEASHTVSFKTDGGNPKPEDQNISYPYGRVQRPTTDPTREGYQFDGWFIDEVAYDFSKPVTDNLTLTAHWTNKSASDTWNINPNKGSQLGGQKTTITPPANTNGIKFNQTSGGGDPMQSQIGYSLAVGSDGNAYAWGNNLNGQLGDGTTTQRTTPVMVKKPDRKTYTDLSADFTYVQVSAGGQHSLALGSDGYVYAWGWNYYGQLGNGSTGGYSTAPVRVQNPNNSGEGLKAIQISAGLWNSMALGDDGTVYTWGSISKDGYRNHGTNPQTIPSTVKDPSDTSEVFHATQVSTHWTFDMAIGQDGYVYAWGYNGNGQLGNNSIDGTHDSATPSRVFASSKSTAAAGPWLKAVQVSAGGWYALAIDENGNTWTWGQNLRGQLGNGTSYDSSVPVQVRYPADAGTVKIVQVSTGTWHSLAIDEDGNTWAWGWNSDGQLGNNTLGNQSSPAKVFASSQSKGSSGPWLNAKQVSGGCYHTLAIDTHGNVRTWGNNTNSQLGNPDVGSRSLAPVLVVFNLQPVITSVRFDSSTATNLTNINNSNSVTVTTPEHLPGTVTVSVDYMLGGAGQVLTDKSLTYTYTPLGVLPQAGGEGILLALATGMTGMGGVMACRRHRREQLQLLHASHE